VLVLECEYVVQKFQTIKIKWEPLQNKLNLPVYIQVSKKGSDGDWVDAIKFRQKSRS
jgi:hypothetical protein